MKKCLLIGLMVFGVVRLSPANDLVDSLEADQELVPNIEKPAEADTLVQDSLEAQLSPALEPEDTIKDYQELYEQTDLELNNTLYQLEQTELMLDDAYFELRQLKYGKNTRRDDGVKTLASGKQHSGGFGALVFKFTEFRDHGVTTIGLKGGWIINRALAIGFEGHGIIPSAEFTDITPVTDVKLLGGFGGMFLEPIFWSNNVIHLTMPVSGGAGWLGYYEDWENNSDQNIGLISDDVFWYLEPGVAAELNVARNFRFNFGVSYRFTEDLELVNTSSSAFDNMNYTLTLKFGGF